MSELDKIKQLMPFIEDQTSETFCLAKWHHTTIYLATGETHSCYHPAPHKIPLEELKNNPSALHNTIEKKAQRKMMLDGHKPDGCSYCWNIESMGKDFVSDRHIKTTSIYTEERLEEIKTKAADFNVNPEYIEISFSNECNFKCGYCHPKASSRYWNEIKQHGPYAKSTVHRQDIDWFKVYAKEEENPYVDAWWEWWPEVSKTLNILRITGGEPLMIKEHKQFIEEIIRQGYQDKILLRYNSNGILVDEDLIELWSKFKKVKFAVSMDAIKERDEYIRFPTKWEVVEKNLQMLDNTPDNIQTSLATAIQIFNVKHLPDFMKWKVESGFKKLNLGTVPGDVQMGGGLVNMHLLYIPTFLSIQILPKEDKQEVEQRFMEFKDWLWNNYRKDDEYWKKNPYGWRRWEAVLAHMNQKENSFLLPGFKEYVNKLDAIRGVNAKNIFPELGHLL